MTGFRSIDDLELHGKRVLIRADLNVPVIEGEVSDATRIERLLPTLNAVISAGGKPILLSHFGRPKGQVVTDMSLQVVVPSLEKLTGKTVQFIDTDWKDISAAAAKIADASPGTIIVMQNTRFHPGEEENDGGLAARMAALGDVYVNDAFSAAHRAHASTEALAHLLPSAAGRAMQSELEALGRGLGNPKRPVAAIIGGAKVSSKIDVLEHLIEKVDALVIGGGMANTFLHAMGLNIGKSLCEKDLAATAVRIMDRAADAKCAIVLPIDATVAWHFEANAPNRQYGIDAIDPDGMILDVGRASIERIKGVIDDAHTLVWNGPLGAFELPPFDTGTVEVAKHAAARTQAGKLVSIAGGGDTVSALAHAGAKDDFTYVSTAGGAFLEWMEGKTLPGVAALSDT